MEKKTIFGREYDVYTDQDWERDGTLKVEVGQLISPDVYYQLLNALPPKCYGSGVFQPGEPDSHDWDTGQALFQTFEHVGHDYHKYVGLRP